MVMIPVLNTCKSEVLNLTHWLLSIQLTKVTSESDGSEEILPAEVTLIHGSQSESAGSRGSGRVTDKLWQDGTAWIDTACIQEGLVREFVGNPLAWQWTHII